MTTGDGGDLTLKAESLEIDSGAFLSASTFSTYKGGNLTVDADNIEVNNGSFIGATTFGSADASNLIVQGTNLKGGAIRIVADNFIASPDSVVEAEARNRLGIAGIVELSSPDKDHSGALVPLSTSFIDAATIMLTPCAQRSGADVSSLIVKKYEVLPDSPYTLRAHLPAVASGAGKAIIEHKVSIFPLNSPQTPATFSN